MTAPARDRDSAPGTGPVPGTGSAAPETARLRSFYSGPGAVLSSGPDRARRQAAMLRSALAGRGGPRVIVDVGCGDGFATALVASLDSENLVLGVDWSATALARAAARGLRVVRGDLSSGGLPLADSSADVVIMSELIEHLVDTDAAVDEARRVLRPGGLLLLSTPNLAAWFNRVLLLAGVQPVFSEVSLRGVYGRPGRVVAGHLRLFTPRALTSFLAARGFACERISGAPYHDVPRPLRFLDRALCRWPSLSSILLIQARRALCRRALCWCRLCWCRNARAYADWTVLMRFLAAIVTGVIIGVGAVIALVHDNSTSEPAVVRALFQNLMPYQAPPVPGPVSSASPSPSPSPSAQAGAPAGPAGSGGSGSGGSGLGGSGSLGGLPAPSASTTPGKPGKSPKPSASASPSPTGSLPPTPPSLLPWPLSSLLPLPLPTNLLYPGDPGS